jgi:NitT/TauT family transport system substrate-binding protein
MNSVNAKGAGGLPRRRFLVSTSALGAASFLGLPRAATAEPPPEVRRIRLFHAPVTCLAPLYLAEELLRLEGFSEVEYFAQDLASWETGPAAVAAGKVDLTMWDALHNLQQLDAGKPLVLLAGVHAGCWELLGKEGLRSLRDLKGKTVAIWGFGAGDHTLLSSMMAYVGMDPRKDVRWLPDEKAGDNVRRFIDGEADAIMCFAPQQHELRAKGIKARVLVNTTQDKPWSQYFCCMVTTNREFVQKNPIATKRALRAILKAADICAQQPERAARYMTTKGYDPNYEIALEVLKELPYRRWRDASPEDTIRFHGLRLREAGLIKSTPQALIAQGTDWRFLNQLKRELKA